MYWWWVVPIVASILAISIPIGGLALLFGRSRGGLAAGTVGAGLAIALGLAFALVGLDIQTYRRLSYERPVATVDFRQTSAQSFMVTLHQEGAPEEEVTRDTLLGDEWRLEARVLKWKPWAAALGLDSRYRLERLSGEFLDASAEAQGPRNVADLQNASEQGTLRRLARQVHRFGVVDTLYGSAVVMPMADGARYDILISQTGLFARPANDQAAQAVGRWR